MARHDDRRGWTTLFGVVLVVLAAAMGAGALLRDPQPAVDTVRHSSSGGSMGNTTGRRPPEPGPAAVVLLEDAALYPEADRIRALLQKYFDAINAGDYRLWRSTVIPQWARDLKESAWRAQYRSTLEGTIVVHRLEPRTGGGLLALTSFTSVQNPADAPPELPVRCLRWWVSYPLIGTGEQLRLGSSVPSADRRMAC